MKKRARSNRQPRTLSRKYSIGIDNATRQHLSLAFFRKVAEETLKTLRCESAEMGVRFFTPAEMSKISETYRGKRGPTSVLSFVYEDYLSEKPVLRGDVALCPKVARKEAAALGQTVDKRLAVLLIHGIVHLAGYTHASERQARRMESMERKTARKLKLL